MNNLKLFRKKERKKAKERNDVSPNEEFILRVRGNSKNGFRLKKVPKNKTHANQQQ